MQRPAGNFLIAAEHDISIRSRDDVTDAVGAGLGRGLIIAEDDLGPAFFDLRTGLAVMRIVTILLLLMAGVLQPAPAQTGADEVASFLHNLHQWRLGKSKRQPNVTDLKHLGDAAIPLLANFLTDRELGYTAEDVMTEIDSGRAAPYIFASMPRSDRNVRYQAFTFYIRLIRNRQCFDHAQAMHDAAVRCLKAGTNADTAEQALLAIGLTGSSNDFALLERYFNNTEPVEFWRTRLKNAGEASLAKLGHERYVENIAQKLISTVPDKIDVQIAAALSDAIREAEFSGDKRFVPALCGKLKAVMIDTNGHALMSSPAQEAAKALAYIVDGSSPDKTASVEQWRDRCKKLY